MFSFLNPFKPYLKVIAIGAAVVVLTGIYVKGRVDGKSALLAKLASDRVQILQDGREVDEKVFSADDNELCALIGGCPDGLSDNGN